MNKKTPEQKLADARIRGQTRRFILQTLFDQRAKLRKEIALQLKYQRRDKAIIKKALKEL